LMYFVDETPLLESAAKRFRDKSEGQVSMFDLFGDDEDSGFAVEVPAPNGDEWPKRQVLQYEKEIMNAYVSDHPLRPYKRVLATMSKFRIGELALRENSIERATFVGMVSSVVPKFTRSGKRMAVFSLEDDSGAVDVVCFDLDKKDKETGRPRGEAIVEDNVVRVRGRYDVSDGRRQILADEIAVIDLPEADEPEREKPHPFTVVLRGEDMDRTKSFRLNQTLRMFPGNDNVVILVCRDGRNFRSELPITVDSRNVALKSEVNAIYGRNVVQ
ncbi:MAG: DNA polymerase III subunit alpha, partial [Eggerthellaceae bacterium]|nr:DNA polymerase III subunit alpha [Eggerthellaceae bacterium]